MLRRLLFPAASTLSLLLLADSLRREDAGIIPLLFATMGGVSVVLWAKYTIGRDDQAHIRYWRVMFWATAVHFALFALFLVLGRAGEVYGPALRVFPAHEIGVGMATAQWLTINWGLTLWAMLLGDLAAMRILWALMHGRVRRKSLFLYLGLTGFAALLEVVAAYAVARAGVVRTATDYERVDIGRFFIACYAAVLFGLPALLLLAGRIIFGRWYTPDPGLCPCCGYDLRASKERCPECGKPVDPSAASPLAEGRLVI